MLNIKLNSNYRITADSMCYTLQRVSIAQEVDKRGEEIYSNIAYCGTLESALKSYKELRIKQSDSETIQEVLEALRKIDLHIQEVLGGI